MEAQETSDVEYLIRTINEEGKVVYKSANLISSNDGATVPIDGDSTTEGSHENMQILTMEVEGDPQVVGKDIILELCRICGGGSDRYIHVFDDEGLQHDLRGKIHRHLPLKVSEGDSLPLQICYNCATTLLAFDDMHKNCLNTQTRLRDIVSKFVSKTSNAHHDTSLTNDLIATLEGTEDSKIEVIQDDSRSNGVDELFEAFSPETSNSKKSILLEIHVAKPSLPNEPEHDTEQLAKTETSSSLISRRPVRSRTRSKMKQEVKCETPGRESSNSPSSVDPRNPTIDFDEPELPDRSEDLKIERVEKKKKGNKRHECEQCNLQFRMLSSYENHLRKHTDDRPFTCHICGKQFGQTGSLYYHLKHHHGGVKNHACDICGRRFAMKTAMMDHRRIHTGERPFICDSCGKAFKTSASLYVHSKVHKDEYPFECSFCKKTFKYKSQLNSHLTIHTGEKNHVCEVCGRGFGVKNELTRHLRTHSIEKPFTCDVCGLSFKQKRYLRSHCRTRHKVSI
ncbi:hypothetical protein QAD02_005601 [Eretmocerus hayati]|uniref:Uncharacterized protein n=1 Tax=Eretmocerus hayati TaxID=131215 RepID=A0ACC2NTC0_9HYME|nr:hypothetical protein QAD02_005601 [Eretmocerus hayati]